MKKFRQYPLERQLFLCFLAVSALVTAIALVMALYLDIRRQRESIDSVISGTAAFVSSMDEVGDMLRQGYPSTAVSDTLDKLHRTLPEIDAIAVYNRSGLRFYHTDRQEAGETFVSGEETAILEGAAPYIISGYSTFGNQRRAFHAVESGGEIVGFVTVSIFSAGILANTRSLLASFLLVMAVGVRPATELAQSLGLDAARGIHTNAQGETDIPDIFAAGDCAKSFDVTTDTERVLALLPNATQQGEICGLAMAGKSGKSFNAIPMNAMGMFGLHMITAGTMTGDDHIIRENGSYKRLCTKDDRLMGYILVGNVARAGIYTALIREKTPLSSIDFELMLDKPQLMAFSRRDRATLMGGSRL